MYAQNWYQIPDITTPYPDRSEPDYDAILLQQGYTPHKMFQLADNFFQGLNMSKMTDKFWANSVIEKPAGKTMVCHPSAFDMLAKDDFRIKMCADVKVDVLATIHHEMGHIQYYMHYKDQPLLFREGANNGFHEAIGDTIILSFLTNAHLRKIGLLTSKDNSYEADINYLMKMALKKFVLLPYSYTLESFRWDFYSGAIKEENLNCEYWKRRMSIQGVVPPVPRTEEDFDAGAKHHVSSDVPYIRYFVAAILQFQFHEALCLKAGRYDPSDETKPLHQCDIDRSVTAGNALSEVLALGSSQPWPDVLAKLTGGRKMDSRSILSFFKPLQDWLEKDNQKHGVKVGWNEDVSNFCTEKTTE